MTAEEAIVNVLCSQYGNNRADHETAAHIIARELGIVGMPVDAVMAWIALDDSDGWET